MAVSFSAFDKCLCFLKKLCSKFVFPNLAFFTETQFEISEAWESPFPGLVTDCRSQSHSHCHIVTVSQLPYRYSVLFVFYQRRPITVTLMVIVPLRCLSAPLET